MLGLGNSNNGAALPHWAMLDPLCSVYLTIAAMSLLPSALMDGDNVVTRAAGTHSKKIHNLTTEKYVQEGRLEGKI
ncbi:hypothetical protein J6590_021207 [Homalodisca vitripennis]|nr:hypothetical protein J6590_021207 [Homalodisca vitripennis]